MADTTITSANSIFILTVPGLYSGVKLEGYAVDNAFTNDPIDFAEVQMGVDGRMTAGYVPNPTKISISLQADSPSRDIFSVIAEATKAMREIYWMTGVITLPSTGETYALTKGVMTNAKQFPDVKKVLGPVEVQITFESVHRSII